MRSKLLQEKVGSSGRRPSKSERDGGECPEETQVRVQAQPVLFPGREAACSPGAAGSLDSALERLEEQLAQKADAAQLREKAEVSLVNRVSSAVQKLQQTASQKEKLLQEL